MRAYLPDYDFQVPSSLKETFSLLSQPKAFPFAGGTDLMVLFEAGKLPAGTYVSLQKVKELHGIKVSKDWVTVGALVSYTEIQEHPLLVKEFPNLVHAARLTGAVAIQNRGTLGGNIANASPAADSPPALLSYDAEIELISTSGTRRVAYADFHLDYKKTAMNSGELIRAIWLPRKFKKHKHYYRKVGTRKMQAISKVVMAATLLQDKKTFKEVRIGLGSVAPMPIRAKKTEAFLLSAPVSKESIFTAKETVLTDVTPIDDIRSSKVYRQRVQQNLVEEFLWNGIGLKR